MCDSSNNSQQVAAAKGVGDAVGVHVRQWYVAVVGHNTEKASRDRLLQLGYDSYVASQEEIHRWGNGRKKKVERVVISSLIFIHATEEERLRIVTLPFIKYFLTDKARTANDLGRHPLATIPDSQMQQLRFMLYNADATVDFVTERIRLGDRIRVIRGSLKGFEGNVTRYKDGSSYVVARIENLGYAMMKVSAEDVELINEHEIHHG